MPGNTALSKQQHSAQQNKTSQKHTSQNWPLFRYCYTGIEFVKSQSSLHVAAATHRDKACTALLHTEQGISRTYCATFAQFTRWEEWLRICHKVYKVFPISFGARLDFYLISELGPCSTSGYVTFRVHYAYDGSLHRQTMHASDATSGVSASRALNIKWTQIETIEALGLIEALIYLSKCLVYGGLRLPQFGNK